MSDLIYIKEKVDKMDTKIDTLLLASVNAARVQGEHEGTLKGHSTQIGWIWALVSGSIMLTIGSFIRSIT